MANDTTTSLLNDRRPAETIDTAKTLAVGDCGVVQNVTKTATITLPATVVGYSFTIRNRGALVANAPVGARSDGSVTITVAPNASDNVAGGAWTAADNKAITNTSGNIGDEIVLVADGVNGYMVVSMKGTWTRAA